MGQSGKLKLIEGGYDQRNLADEFEKYGYECVYITFSKVFAAGNDWKGRIVLYTSSEEHGNNYKQYIEDIVCGLEEAGAIVFPRGVFLRAHNNKVLMEILGEQLLGKELTGLKSLAFGTLEELKAALQNNDITFPCVLKPAIGSMSRGVSQADTALELIKNAKVISRTSNLRYELRDLLRTYRSSLKGYKAESRYQNRFIVQPMVSGLDGDWKVLVYGKHYYVLKRHVRPGDFRASGSHYNYLAGGDAGIPDCVLDMVKSVYEKLKVPHLSADVAFDGTKPYLIEFQCLYFGTSTQAEFCDEYISKVDGTWKCFPKTMTQEEVYVYGVDHFLQNQHMKK